MAGQSDAADDLIAELAKLMAHDARGDDGTKPASAAPLFPIRIPGDETPQPPLHGKADLDFVRNFNTQPAPQPAMDLPRTPAPKTADDLPDPFKFDFDFGASRQPVADAPTVPAAPKPELVAPQLAAKPEPAAAQLAIKPEPVPVQPPVKPEPVAPQVAARPAPAPTPAPAPALSSVDHDSIADLIAAELAVDAHQAQAKAAAAPIPAPKTTPAPAASAPEPAPEPRQSSPAQGWTPTTVAANLAGQQRSARPALRAVNLQPVARSEQDSFKVPPVFGLGTTPARSAETIVPVATPEPAPVSPPPIEIAQAEPRPRPAAPPVVAAPVSPPTRAAEVDPIDEIENLIGRAMRVEFDRSPEPEASMPPEAEVRPAPSPALRSLATPTVAPAPSPSALSAADEAVLAAAQATGAEVGWVEAPEVSDTEPPVRQRADRSRPAFGMTRAVAGPLVAVTLLLAAGFGLYWVLGLGGRDTGGVAPLLTADASPVKQVAPQAASDTAAAQQSVVFNEIDGVVPGAEEQLVSRDQADVNEVTQVAAAPPADVSEEGLANRKVRTVTVRPDGTIVSGEDSIAGSAILPVDRPNVPAVPGAETASPELLAAADATATSTAAVAAPATATPAAEPAPSVTPVEPGATVPVVDVAGNPVAGKTAVVPLLRPAGLSVSAPTAASAAPVNAIVDPVAAAIDAAGVTAPAATAPAQQPAAAIPGATEVAALPNDAPAYVQLASQRSEAEARQTAQSMVTRFGPLFGGANMEVQRVDLGAKGIYYRVRVPAQSLEQANNICVNVKAAGGDCFTM